MTPGASTYVLSSTILAGAGLAITARGVTAYLETGRRSMIYVAVGFALLAATAIVSGTTAFVTGLKLPRSILVYERGVASLGVLLVLYSLLTYDVDG